MNQLTGILLHVNTGDADTLRPVGGIDIHIAMLTDGQVKLRGLEVLRQIRIVVVLAVKFAEMVDFAIHSETGLDGKLNDPTVYYRQNAGQSEADRADMGILFGTEAGSAAAENFRIGFQLAVNLETDYCFVFHYSAPPSGTRVL